MTGFDLQPIWPQTCRSEAVACIGQLGVESTHWRLWTLQQSHVSARAESLVGLREQPARHDPERPTTNVRYWEVLIVS
jgi:hypothetical protein